METQPVKYKSPIISIFGHVDAGKTSLIDAIKNTNKASSESGGITQSIGSYFINIDDIEQVTKSIKNEFAIKHEIPGFIIIDTPGHSAFSSMRTMGSSLCNIAILVIDFLDGLQPQTRECISLLKNKNIPFIIAVSKIDKIYGWTNNDETNFKKSYKLQSDSVKLDFQTKLEDLKYELSTEDVIAELYLNNKNQKKVFNIVPYSSHTKVGLPDLLNLIVYISQNFMANKITYRDNFKATIIDSGLDNSGHYIDIILTNGTINTSNNIIVTNEDSVELCSIRSIHKNEAIMVGDKFKNQFIKVNNVEASCGLRIYGTNLSNPISGTKIYKSDKDSLDFCDIINQSKQDMIEFKNKFTWSTNGIYLITPTIGEFDAAMTILNEAKINVVNGSIGSLKKVSITKYNNYLVNSNEVYEENRIILYFNTKNQKIDSTIIDDLKENSIELIQYDVIYKLIEMYKKRKEDIINTRKEYNYSHGLVVFPCYLQILEDKIFKKGSTGCEPFIFGVKVINGTLHKGTPIITDTQVYLGTVKSIKNDKKDIDKIEKGKSACIQLSNDEGKLYPRHFNYNNKLYSKLSRSNIDILKKDYRTELCNKEWSLVKEIVTLLKI